MEGQYAVAAVMAAVGDSTGVELVAAEGSPAVAAETQAGEAVVGDAVTVVVDAAAAAAIFRSVKRKL